MKNFIVQLVISAALLMLVAYCVPGVHVSSFFSALFAALLFGIVNGILRPILVILTLPVTILTLGLFLFVVNALMMMVVAWLVPGFHIDNFVAALLGSILLTILNVVADTLLQRK